MQKFIVLLRGINVGGNNLLPMKEFVLLLQKHNFESVSSYIQSGNIVLKSVDDPTGKIKEIISENYDFSPDVFTLNGAEFSQVHSSNPYDEFEGKFVHFYFCKNDIYLNQGNVDKFITESEQYTVKNNVFYLYAPNGIGRSKLVANIESTLMQSATGRNLNTINKISYMLKNS